MNFPHLSVRLTHSGPGDGKFSYFDVLDIPGSIA
jgi:hypothetical protein